MSELGFTFYPKDWWASDSFFDLTPIQRYYYLECLFLMYIENGSIKTQKTQIEKRLQTKISETDWQTITQKFETVNEKYTHVSVNKRLRKTLANRENGKKGGRPKKNPENPINNPPLESKDKIEIKGNNKWNTSPSISDVGELPKQNIESVKQRVYLSKGFLITDGMVCDYWESWKVEKLTGQKFYPSIADVYSHFSNSAKDQPFRKPDDKEQKIIDTKTALSKYD
jgi:hypothetical protein